MNPTMKKFGYPLSCIQEFERWVVLLRPQQVTLGSLVLVCKEPAGAFSMLSREAFVELYHAVQQIEGVLKRVFAYDKINYLMLMMVDPDVHFHVVPRYGEVRRFAGHEFYDHGWPGPPALKRINTIDDDLTQTLTEHLKRTWI